LFQKCSRYAVVLWRRFEFWHIFKIFFTGNSFYDLIEREIDRLGLKDRQSHIWNFDESAFCVDPSRGRVVAETGSSAFRVTAGTGRECFTAMAAVNAAGESLSPFIIFRGKNLQSTWKGSSDLPGTAYSVSGEFFK
jgi:hypothetical protein